MLLAKEQRHQPLALVITVITRAASGPILIRLRSQCSSFILLNQSRALVSLTTENLVLPGFLIPTSSLISPPEPCSVCVLGCTLSFSEGTLPIQNPGSVLVPGLTFSPPAFLLAVTQSQHNILYVQLQRDLFNFSPSSPTYLHPLPVFWVQTHSPPWVLPCLGSTSWHSWGWRNTLAQPLSATWRCSSPDRFFPISSLQWQLLFTFSLQMRSCSPLIHQADHVIKPRQLCFTFFLDPLLQHIKQMFHCQGSLGSNSHLSLSIKKATLSFVPLMIKALISLLKHSGRHLWAFSHAAVSANLPSLSSKFSFDVMSIKSLSAGLWVCWHHATNSA